MAPNNASFKSRRLRTLAGLALMGASVVLAACDRPQAQDVTAQVVNPEFDSKAD